MFNVMVEEKYVCFVESNLVGLKRIMKRHQFLLCMATCQMFQRACMCKLLQLNLLRLRLCNF
jgi:hypothetical protein